MGAAVATEPREMRVVYAETLVRLAENSADIVILEADLMKASATGIFQKRFPERAFNIGVAEANMVGIAAGLSASGKIPFAASFTCFASRRAYDQFFISCNYAGLNVKLVGTDPGIAAEYNGGTHMCFEDLGLMRNVPGLVVFEPCDPVSLAALVERAAAHRGCTYLRLHRKPIRPIYPDGEAFELGRGKVLRDGGDVTLVATGAIMVPEALAAAERLASDGVSAAVIDMHTVKPIDRDLVLEYARKTRGFVSCENHQIVNGLGSAMAEVLCEGCPRPLRRVGIRDEFGEVGTLDYLKARYRLTAGVIADEAHAVLKG
ncbi:MAG: transketolase family protein [Verrucomicrobiae bacterium]|nr:transketolase family protein [Verrucomicrobiae bacterium]